MDDYCIKKGTEKYMCPHFYFMSIPPPMPQSSRVEEEKVQKNLHFFFILKMIEKQEYKKNVVKARCKDML